MFSLIVIGPLFLIIFIVLFTILYKVYYNRQVNKALETGIPSKTLSPTVIILALAGLGLVVLNLIGLAQINDTQWGVMQLSDRLDYIHTDLFDIREELDEKIEQESKNSYDVAFLFQSYENEATVFDLEFKVKEVKKDAVVSIVLEDKDGVLVEVPATIDGLGYKAELSMLKSEYYNIYLKLDSADSLYQEKITEFKPHLYLETRFIEQYLYMKYSSETVMVRVYNGLDRFGGNIEDLGIASMEVVITTDYGSTEETIPLELVFDEFFKDELDERVEGFGTLSTNVSEDEITFAYVRVTDEAGITYAFVLEPEYRNTVNLPE